MVVLIPTVSRVILRSMRASINFFHHEQLKPMIITVNPATEEPIAEYQAMTSGEIEEILQASRRDALSWKKVSLEDRCMLMRGLAELMRQQKERHAARRSFC